MSNVPHRVKAAFQGERGAFSEDAARQLIGPEVETLASHSFDDMFNAVLTGAADCAIAPIENSLAGSVIRNFDLLEDHDLTIIGETYVRIVLNLIAPVGVSLEDLSRVYSHPVALAQCERFLRAHPEIHAEAAYDTAGSVKMVTENGRRDEAGIAGATAAEMYGAQILAAGIEDNPKNFTRFLLLTRPERAAEFATISGGARKKTNFFFVA